MAQVHKGPRRQVASRMPEQLIDDVYVYAQRVGLTVSEAVADLVALQLGKPLPSETLPKPKNRRQREELPLARTA